MPMVRHLATMGTTLITRMIALPMDITERAGSMMACSSASALGMDLAGAAGVAGATDAASVTAVTDIAAAMDTAADTVAMDLAVDTAAIEAAATDALAMAAQDGLDTAERGLEAR
jgi:hypothetical protein